MVFGSLSTNSGFKSSMFSSKSFLSSQESANNIFIALNLEFLGRYVKIYAAPQNVGQYYSVILFNSGSVGNSLTEFCKFKVYLFYSLI